jgi:large subunit ribosomal protein L2
MNRKLKTIRKKNAGRSYGKVVVRHQGGEHKRFLRNIDFKRNKVGAVGRVVSLEYDPNRTVKIALVHYADGEKRYIIAPLDLNVGDSVSAGKDVDIRVGNTLPLSSIPVGTVVNNIEITPGRGGQIARGAGTGATLQAREGQYVHLKLPSGEIRRLQGKCLATVGVLSNIDWKNEFFGKAGRKRNMGIRPTVRGVAMNPRSHAHGGGEGRSGIGLKRPKTYAGRPAFGKTRNPKKYSNKYIVAKRGTK